MFFCLIRRITMRLSKLEMHIEVLKVLALIGPQTLTQIMKKTNVNCSELKENLNFLLKQGLVENQTPGKTQVIFAVSQRGIAVLTYFNEIKQVPRILELTDIENNIILH